MSTVIASLLSISIGSVLLVTGAQKTRTVTGKRLQGSWLLDSCVVVGTVLIIAGVFATVIGL